MTGVGGGNIRNHVQFNLYTNKWMGEGGVRRERDGRRHLGHVRPRRKLFFFFFLLLLEPVKGVAVAFFHSNR